MTLTITNSQAKTMMGMGAVAFEVKALVQLTPEEQSLVKLYRLDNETLVSKPEMLFGSPTGNKILVTVKQLLSGEAFKCKDLTQVISYKRELKDSCDVLKNWLEVCRDFGGKEVHQY